MASRAMEIPEELLAEIFLRLPDPADLARVSATCPTFRRLTTDRSFLRRYRKLHPPPFLGFVDRRKAFHPAQMPHLSAPAARAVALTADFSFSFLPSPALSWVIQDVRDGRFLLLDCKLLELSKRRVFTDLVVCDPLYRQYLLLPSVPDALAASVEDPHPPAPMRWCEPFLVPPSEEEKSLGEETAFRVMWMAQYETKLAIFDFSSSTGQWRVTSSKCWGDLFPTEVMSKVWSGSRILLARRYVYGCFYWVTNWENMIELDIGKMEFSVTDFIPREWVLRNAAIVEAGEGRHGMIFPENYTGYGFTSDLRYTIRRNNGQGSSQWQMEMPISIPLGYRYNMVGETGKNLVLEMTKENCQRQDFEYFSLDVKTLHRERVCESKCGISRPQRYTNFPPSLLSSPTVSSGMKKGAAEEMLEQGATS